MENPYKISTLANSEHLNSTIPTTNFQPGMAYSGTLMDRFMTKKISKRDTSEVDFDRSKIEVAIGKANRCMKPENQLSEADIEEIARSIEEKSLATDDKISVEDIQDMVEESIMGKGKFKLAKAYITFRDRRELLRRKNTTDDKILTLLKGSNAEIMSENANKNPTVLSTQRDYMAGEVSKDISKRYLIPEDIIKAHEAGEIHFHDMDYFAMSMYNCCLINLDDMLQNGTVISKTLIEKPHTFHNACNIASQIVAQVASSQYGGQTISATHLAKFVEPTRQYIRESIATEIGTPLSQNLLSEFGEDSLQFWKELYQEFGTSCMLPKKPITWSGRLVHHIIDFNEQNSTITLCVLPMGWDAFEHMVHCRLKKNIKDGIQTLQYQLITLQTTNGQTPFVSVCLYLNEADTPELKADLAMVIEEILRQRIKGVKNENGSWYANPFPKLLYILEEDNVRRDGKYFYLTKLAVECTAKRMVPDYISEKVMIANKIDKNGEGHCYPVMGCRSCLSPYVDENNVPKYYGRFNQGVVTWNILYTALKSGRDEKLFWKEVEEALNLCHRALRVRHEHLLGTLSDVAPILWQHGAIARLKKGETIDKLLYGGYSTISLGYAGVYEATKYMTGYSHTDPRGKEFALKLMHRMNDACNEWKAAENIGYSVYGTPIESTTEKFARACKRDFGVIEGITDRNFVTNSYHVPVFEEINAFDKIKFESEFQLLSPGGAISYVETSNMVRNLEALEALILSFYDTTIYAEVNCELDWCHCCGGTGTIKMVRDPSGKLIWKCMKCGNTNKDKMNVVRRICGYLGNAEECAQGRMEDMGARVKHMK